MSNTLKFGNGEWATKEGSTLAYNSENGNFKPLPFDFTRATTATRVNKEGLIEVVGNNEPRIDFTDDSKGALLLEPQRTNSLLHSNQFDTTWATSNATVTGGQIGVGGSTDAWLLNSLSGFILQTLSLSGVSTMSIYAKKGTAQGIRVRIDADVDANCYIDLSNGNELFPYTGTNLEVINVGNDWYKISLSIDSAISNVRLYAIDNTAISTSGTVYIQYAQLEQGSYPTSYIPTSGSAVTRVADVCEGAGNEQVFNDSEGVLFAEISALTDIGSNQSISISDGSFDNRILFRYNGTNEIRVIVVSNSFLVFDKSLNISSINEYNKFIIKYKQDNFALWVNGFELEAGNSGATPTGLNELAFDDGSGINDFYGNIKQIQYFDKALTDQELAALTKI